jgi:hypothetical protein
MAKAKEDLSPEAKRIMEEIGNEVVAALKGEFFEVEGAPMSVVKYEDNRIRQKPLMPTWLFQFEYAYVGGMGRIQFGLSPEDAQEYKFIEMNPKELDRAFPLVGAAVAKHYGVEGENLKILLDEIFAKRIDTVAAAQEKAREEAAASYEANPIFGAFLIPNFGAF